MVLTYAFFPILTRHQHQENTGKQETVWLLCPLFYCVKRRAEEGVAQVQTMSMRRDFHYGAAPCGAASWAQSRHKAMDYSRSWQEPYMALSEGCWTAVLPMAVKTIHSIQVIFYRTEWQKLRKEIERGHLCIQYCRLNKFRDVLAAQRENKSLFLSRKLIFL